MSDSRWGLPAFMLLVDNAVLETAYGLDGIEHFGQSAENFRDQFVKVNQKGKGESQMSSIQGWIITKCPFSLTKFSNSYFKNSFLAQFWTPQSENRVLAIPTCTNDFPVYDDQLPNLIALEIGDVQALPVDRPLQRIQLRWGRNVAADLDQLSSLGRYSATLTTLNLLQTSVTQRISTREIFDTVSLGLPGLLHLGITEIGESLIASRKIIRLAPWRNSPTLRPSSSTAKPSPDSTYEFGDLLSLQIFGLSIMNACPTLRRADIGSHVSPATDIWYPGSKKRELACTLTRSPDGDVESVCATRFDFHAVGMFW
ncbi:hypothetical protein B0H14DRAFT_3152676 [Mycena olivaceomarginata]|nr:hypothetical protein B0H14DRAFT_3152676 [Mycena olivaceomarginata]